MLIVTPVIATTKMQMKNTTSTDYSGESEPLFWRKVSHPDLL
jgi:hypothetical protein